MFGFRPPARIVGRSLPVGRPILAMVVAMLLAMLPGIAAAQTTPLATLSAQLGQAETDLRAVDRTLDTRIDRKDRQLLRSRAQAARASASAAAAQLQDQLALVDAKVEQLGPAAPGVVESADIRAQRTSLTQQRSAIDSAIKRGKLLTVEAEQLADEIQQGEAAQFGEKIGARAPSPLSPAFWTAIVAAAPRDLRRIAASVSGGVVTIGEQWRRTMPWQAVLGAIVAVILLGPVRLRAAGIGQRLLIEGAPGRRVRRSAYALWRVVIGTLAPLLAAAAIVQGVRWSSQVPADWSRMFDAFVGAAGFAGFTGSVLGTLLMRGQPSWRLAPIADVVAIRLRPYSLMLAVLAFASILLEAFNATVGASEAAQIAGQAAEAALHLLLIGAALLAVGRLRVEDPAANESSARAGLGAITLIAWLLVIVALLALLAGYVGLGLFLGQMVAWGLVLGAAVYLLMVATDDVTTTLFERDSSLGRTLTRGLGLRGSSVDQFGVLLSAVLRLALAIVAIGLLLTPFGAGNGIGSIFGRLGVIAQGIEIGGISVSPGTIVRGLIVLFVGLALVRGFMRWLEYRYLPATDLDGSGRNSVSLVARYVGIALATIWALASLGIGVERIALLLSALSVGIGFGLQAITQNFVSGLILLAERPIKIGDLIRVGNDEGDVKRISVRSTEIELADHSTLIVPNSELITKSVLNKTLANPLGRIQIKFSVPIEVDAEQVRGIVLTAFADEQDVLDDPAPTVFIDGIVDGRILFNSYGHVASPRAVYPARSGIFRVLLQRFREQHIEVGTFPQKLELVTPPDSGG